MSYWVAVPVLPSSPGAVQVSLRELEVGVSTARFATADGDVVSGAGEVVPFGELEIADQLGVSSAVLMAK